MAAGRHHIAPMPSSRSRLGSGSSSYFADRDGPRDREYGYREREHERDYSRDGYHYKEKERERERERERDRERERARERELDRYRDRDRERERVRDRERDAERGERLERSERAGKSGRSSSRYEEGEVGRRVSPLQQQRPGSGGVGGGGVSVPESPSSDETSGISGGGTHGGHGYRRSSGRHSAKDVEREPGELSSGSRSEEAGEGAVAGQPSRSSRSSHHRQGVEGKADSVSPPAPKKQRKYSPIVWDLDDKLTASDAALGATSSRVSPSKAPQAVSGTSLSPSAAPVSSLTPSPALASPLLSTPPKLYTSPSNAVADGSPASASGAKSTPPTMRTASPFTSLGAVARTTPPSSSERKPPADRRSLSLSPPPLATGTIPNTSVVLSPLSPDRSIFSTYIAENSAEKAWNDLQLLHSTGSTPISEDEPEPGQLSDSPTFDDPEEPIPSINIASSRWAEENASPSEAAEKSPSGKFGKQHSLSVESDELHLSTDQGLGLPGSHHMSPESGEYIKEKSERAGNGGSAGKEQELEHGRDVGLDQQYDRELNERELMELDVEVIHDDDEEQHPEPESDKEETATVPPAPPQRTIDMLQGCRSVDEFERLNKIDEGTYGVVYRARNKNSGEIVALKKVKMEKERDGFPMTSLREINVLLSFHHPSIVDVKEVVVGSNLDSIYMVMEYMEHDLKSLMETMKQPFSQSEVKCLMLQLLEGIKYLHDNWVLHRDLKTSNLLLNNRGELKICDFGLARQYGSPLKSYTHMVVTLWYRAPELLLGTKQYSTAVDMWSAGCIMAEFLAKEPLFNGKSELDQLDKMFKTLGTPNEKIWPDFVNLPRVKCNFVRQPFNKLREKFPPTAFAGRPTLSESGFDLLNRLLTYDPKKRITAEEALVHEWFREVPLPKMKELMPTFPARSEHDRRMRRLMKSPDPLEEQRKRELRQGELGAGGLFG